MRKRSTLICAPAVIAVMLALVAGSARAADSTVVNVLRCDGDGGAATVPAGQPITVQLGGFAVGTFGLMNAVLIAQTTTLKANVATYDLSDQWSTPVYDPTFNFWVTTQPNRPLGTLAAGQTIVVTYDITFTHPVAILFPPVRSSGDNGPFIVTEDGPAVCAITAT